MLDDCQLAEHQLNKLFIDLSKTELNAALNYCKNINVSSDRKNITIAEQDSVVLFRADLQLDFKEKSPLYTALLSAVLEGKLFIFSHVSSFSENEKQTLFAELKKVSPTNLIKYISSQKVCLNVVDMRLSPCGTYIALLDRDMSAKQEYTVFNTQLRMKMGNFKVPSASYCHQMQFIPLSNNLLILTENKFYLFDYVRNESSIYCKNNLKSFYMVYSKEGTFGLNPFKGTIAKYGKGLKEPLCKTLFRLTRNKKDL